ncbi:MAG: PAS domain-containing protein [Candidatus Obscuribacter sp.]|nr:PAS domain-containing protein [Candidatus Obscuribacter sp.]
MNLSTKLTFALLSVVLVVVLGCVTCSTYFEYRNTRTRAGKILGDPGAKQQDPRSVLQKLSGSFENTRALTNLVSKDILKDSRFKPAVASRDKATLASVVSAISEKDIFNGTVWILDENGQVIYSNDTPSSKESNYSMRQDCKAVDAAASNRSFDGFTSSSKTGLIYRSTVVPVPKGILAVNQPINQEFLSGVVARTNIEEPETQGAQLAIYSRKFSKIVGWSQDFPSQTCFPYLEEINKSGFPKGFPEKKIAKLTGVDFIDNLIVPVSGFERKDGWFNTQCIWEGGKDNQDPTDFIGVIFLAKPVPNIMSTVMENLFLAVIVGALGTVVGMFLATRIAAAVNEPMKFLVKRTRLIANNKQVIPPLENLSGEWYELGELIDTAVLSMRSTTQNLKTQLTKQMQQVEERKEQAEQSTQQVDVLNNQITIQAKQIAEYSRTINQSNKQAILVQQQLDAVLQSSTEGYLVLDQYGNILHSNPVFLNWSGTSNSEIAGRLCFDLVRKPGEAAQSEAQAFAQHGGNAMALIEQFYPEAVVYHKTSGKKIEVLAHLQPLSSDDGHVNGYIMVLRDKSLRSENQLLRQEIVSMLRDNIRTPLTSAEAGWSAILNNARNNMHPAVGQSLAELHGNYEQLIGLVDSLLMMYGGTVPQPIAPREQIAITRLVAAALEEVTPLARERQLTLDYKTVTGLPTINSSKEAIMGILRQVLERMILITAAGGRVRVESQLKGADMRIGISSSGPALPEVEIADMFVGFIEGKHSQDTYGPRLSMYLARNNVERMGGAIWAESEAGRGTVTYFTLPLN